MAAEPRRRAEREPLAAAELRTLIRLARKAMWADADTRRALHAAKVNIVPASFYSGVPTVEEIENSFEFNYPDGPYNSPTVFNPQTLGDFLAQLDAYAGEFDPPAEGDREDPAGYFWDNPAFSFSDAMAYYCVLRHLKPKHVLEIGSGFSTLVALQALARNGSGSISCIEPYPMPWLAKRSDIALHRAPVQSFEAEFFNERLADGDVLFIDSTHTVKAGSDCLQIYLRLLPALKSALTVHAHDIYLPFPPPRRDFDRHVYWTEQYLLYAYLLDNPRAKVLYGSCFHNRANKALLDAFMRGRWRSGGASLWFSLGSARDTERTDENSGIGGGRRQEDKDRHKKGPGRAYLGLPGDRQ